MIVNGKLYCDICEKVIKDPTACVMFTGDGKHLHLHCANKENKTTQKGTEIKCQKQH